MKKIILLIFILSSINYTNAQVYNNQDLNTNLILTKNNYFSYQDFSGLIKKHLRGEWKIENNEVILIESYHSPIAENDFSINKVPKFNYKTGNRRSFFKIDGNQLILMKQEIQPENAIFPTEFSSIFTIKE